MLCAIYKSSKKQETYLFVSKRDDFSAVPKPLLESFGKPLFVMVLNLGEKQKLAISEPQKVREALTDKGFYLQLSPPEENMLKIHLAKQKGEKAE